MASDNGEWSYADTDEEILTRIAWYYYNDGLTQNEIGEKLNMSRIKVSRLLESGRPLISIAPELAGITPDMIFMRLDLPAPLPPRSACTSPACKARETPFSTGTAP